MEDTEDVNLGELPDVNDAVVAPKEKSHLSARRSLIGLTRIGKLAEHLGTLVYRLDHAERGFRLVQRDVVVDLKKAALCLCRPDYRRQDWIRRAISSFEIVLPASESARPRSTIATKAISRRSSSVVLSSGWA